MREETAIVTIPPQFRYYFNDAKQQSMRIDEIEPSLGMSGEVGRVKATSGVCSGWRTFAVRRQDEQDPWHIVR